MYDNIKIDVSHFLKIMNYGNEKDLCDKRFSIVR